MSNFLEWLGNTELAFQIGATWWFPLLESVHVLAFSLLVGVMLLVDLRLMGSRILTGRAHLVVGQLTPWAWSAFAVAAITGSGMFIVRPDAYVANPAFQFKFGLLLLAGVNVWYFHSRIPWQIDEVGHRGAHHGPSRFAGIASLTIWFGVLLAGRWTGHLN